MSKITPCLWFDGTPRKPRISTSRSSRQPHRQGHALAGRLSLGKAEGAVITVEFTLAGQPFIGLNGGPQFTFTEAVSFSSTARTRPRSTGCWDALTADGGEPVQCGW